MKSTRLLLTMVAGLGLAAGTSTATAQLPSSNPFSTASTLQYQAPPFNRIKDAD